MKRPNWENPVYAGGVRIDEELESKDLSWLCGCGASKAYVLALRAYPICESCGQRMRILNHARLGYVTDGARQ